MITRSLRKVRSPKLNPRSDESRAAVPLEFDEADEEFLIEREHGVVLGGHDDDDESDFHELEGHFDEGVRGGGGGVREGEQMSEEHDMDNDTMSNSACGGRDSRSVSTPSTRESTPLPEEAEAEPEGWLDDMDAVEEAERFDEISAARLMEEEHMQQQAPIRVPQKGHSLGKGRRKF